MFNFNPMAFWAEKMNPMMNMNNCFSSNCCPITEFMKHWCGDNCYSNPMMHFYKHMMNCCHNHMMNCCNYNNWCDNNSHSKTSCNTNYSFDKNQNCNDNNYCSDFANGFTIYPMMMEKCMKIMSNAYKMSCNNKF